MKNIIFGVSALTLSLTAISAQAQTLSVSDRSLIFNTSYVAKDGITSDTHVRIGFFNFGPDLNSSSHLQEGTLNARYFDYNGSPNYPSNTSSLRHPITAPNPQSCQSGYFETPSNAVYSDISGTYKYDSVKGTLRIDLQSAGSQIWEPKNPQSEYFEIETNYFTETFDANQSLTGRSNSINGVSYTDTRGMAYLSDNPLTNVHVRKANLQPTYLSHILQSTGNQDGVDTQPWYLVVSQPTLSGFVAENPTDPNAQLISAYEAPASQDDVHAVRTIAFGLSGFRNLWHYHGGHAFSSTDPCYNTNGNDGGHKRVYMGVWNADINDSTYVIPKAVGIEYSQETDGKPILSIERWD